MLHCIAFAYMYALQFLNRDISCFDHWCLITICSAKIDKFFFPHKDFHKDILISFYATNEHLE